MSQFSVIWNLIQFQKLIEFLIFMHFLLSKKSDFKITVASKKPWNFNQHHLRSCFTTGGPVGNKGILEHINIVRQRWKGNFGTAKKPVVSVLILLTATHFYRQQRCHVIAKAELVRDLYIVHRTAMNISLDRWDCSKFVYTQDWNKARSCKEFHIWNQFPHFGLPLINFEK